MSESTDLPHPQESKPVPRRRRYGFIALTLWGLAAACSVVDALLAFDRIKVLVFTGGLLMMDIAGAVLASLFWFLSRNLLGPLMSLEAALEYGFRAGQIARRRREPDIHVVLPMQPQREQRGQVAASNGFDHSVEPVS